MQLLADFDWVQIVPVIIFIVVWLVNQVLGGGKDKAAQRRNPPPRGQVPPPAPQRGDAPDQAKVASEIEEFLKRAGERRREKAREAQARSMKTPQPKRPPWAKPPVPPPQEPIIVEVVETGPAGDRVAQHVESHLTTSKFSERAAHMADDIAEADRERKQHERQVFGHQVGKLEDTSKGAKVVVETPTGAPAEIVQRTPSAAAGSLAALLKSGESVRQAIIFSEILQRPEHRW